ncbi:hypothetical protein PG459_004829 [Salmonella enterica]|nr:hypothetical protein [Salmonella enterica]
MTNKSETNGRYGYLFEDPVDEISGDIFIDSGKLPPEMKQIKFDVTAAELAAYLFKPGHA